MATPAQLRKIDEFKDYIGSLSSDSLTASWRQIIGHKDKVSTKVWQLNADKARYKNIKCADNTRVILKSKAFIHANHVQFGPDSQRFIAAQAPLEEGVSDFYHMIVEQNVKVIIMLCKEYEDVYDASTNSTDSKPKCALYLPTSTVPFDTEDYSVHLKETKEFIYFNDDIEECYDKNTLQIYKRSTKVLLMECVHIKYKTWNDHSVPAATKALIRIYEDFIIPVDKKTPVLVHCSAGIGRTGTFLAAYLCSQMIMNGHYTTVDQVVLDLRRQRLHSVQTSIQFLFVFQLCIELLEKVSGQNLQRVKKDLKKFVIHNKKKGDAKKTEKTKTDA